MLPTDRAVEWQLDNAAYGSLLEVRLGIR